MTDTAPPPTAAPTPQPMPAKAASADSPSPKLVVPWAVAWSVWMPRLALALAVLAVALAALLWSRLEAVQREMARRSAEQQTTLIEARTQAAQAQAQSQQLLARLGLAETRLSEVSLQRTQLEELMLSVSRSRDDSLVQDIESALRLAIQQSQLTGSVQPLVSALQGADQRIARAAQPRLNPVQRAIARDIARVQSAALADIPALAARLDEAIRLIDTLPLANGEPVSQRPARRPAPSAAAPSVNPAAPSTAPGAASAASPDSPSDFNQWAQALGRWATGFWQDLQAGATDLVRISRIDRPEGALLTPEQGFFLRENLKLQLLNARIALWVRQGNTARTDLQQAQNALARYFNTDAPAVQSLRQSLQQVVRDLASTEVPRPDDTLSALQAAAAGR